MQLSANGITENKHYVSTGGIVFALYVSRTGSLGTQSSTTTSYFHHDHLGSIVAVSTAAGAVVERLAFDPWGKRRHPNGLPDTLDAIVGVNTERGYTLHEHLDEMGVIHMNGRIYDPLIGRFMSADPFIQSPGNLQSYNRYAYVLNNPLAYTDPSGYFSLRKFLRNVFVRIVAAVADVAGCAGYCTMAVNSYQAYKSGGLPGLASSFIPGADNVFANAAIMAAKGCVVASANGGNCGRGAGSSLIEDQTSGYGVVGRALGGCLSAINQGGSCRSGAGNAVASYTERYIGDGVHAKLESAVREEQYRASMVAAGPGLLLIPPALSAAEATAVWLGRGLIFGAVVDTLRQYRWVLSTNGAESGERTRGLPPEGVTPPAGEVTEGPASRPSERDKGGKSLWDSGGGEWRYSPGDKWHNPHWDYNPHDKPSSPWQNVPIDQLPPRK